MKKRLLSFAVAFCMVLSLLPAAAFAEENAEASVCTCEEACTAEAMNVSCPVCGAEGVSVESCCKYTAPAAEDPELTAVKKAQALIDALPMVEELENADDETVNAVYAAVQAACDALDELTTEELEQVTRVEKLAALLEWLNGSVSTYEGETYPYLNYTIEDNGTITITGLKDGYKNMTDVTIPAKIGGYDVTAIGGWSFENCENITRVCPIVISPSKRNLQNRKRGMCWPMQYVSGRCW